MIRIYQTIIVTIALLFSVQGAQATTFPSLDPEYTQFHDFSSIGTGNYSQELALVDNDPNAAWYKFTLSVDSVVTLDSVGSDISDTILALYNVDGIRLDQNYDCDFANAIITSCLTFSGTAGTMFYAGLAEESSGNTNFLNDWGLDRYAGNQDNVTLNIAVSAVPVPAAVWLFGTALIGFVGMSRRTTVKA